MFVVVVVVLSPFSTFIVIFFHYICFRCLPFLLFRFLSVMSVSSFGDWKVFQSCSILSMFNTMQVLIKGDQSEKLIKIDRIVVKNNISIFEDYLYCKWKLPDLPKINLHTMTADSPTLYGYFLSLLHVQNCCNNEGGGGTSREASSPINFVQKIRYL